jgi:hypothetical protein
LGYSREAADAALEQVPALQQLRKEGLVEPFFAGGNNVTYTPRTEKEQLKVKDFGFAGAVPPLAFKYYLPPTCDGKVVPFPADASSTTVWHGTTSLSNIKGIAQHGFRLRRDGSGNFTCPNVMYFSRTAAVPIIAYAPHIVTKHHSQCGVPRVLHWRVVITARVARGAGTPPGRPTGADGKVRECSEGDLRRSQHEHSNKPPAGYEDPEAVVMERVHWNHAPILPHNLPGVALDDPSMELWVRNPSHITTTGVMLVPWPANPAEPKGLGKPFHRNIDVYCALCGSLGRHDGEYCGGQCVVEDGFDGGGAKGGGAAEPQTTI